MLTTRDIYRALGLDDPDEFAASMPIRFLCWEEYNKDLTPELIAENVILRRRTGRTTRMVIDALSHLSANPRDTVKFKGQTAQIGINIDDMAGVLLDTLNKKLGYDAINHMGLRPESYNMGGHQITFYDHTCHDSPHILEKLDALKDAIAS